MEGMGGWDHAGEVPVDTKAHVAWWGHQQGCEPHLVEEDTDLVPTGVAPERSDGPHPRDHFGQVFAAAVCLCLSVGKKGESSASWRSLSQAGHRKGLFL